MFYMLSCFNLKENADLDQVQRDMTAYAECMRGLNLLLSVDPIGVRDSNTRLDTDAERGQNYYMLTRFEDKDQSNAAVRHIEDQIEPAASLHRLMYAQMTDLVFTCWKDSL